MKTLPLTKTNPYLQDAALRQQLNERSVRSSCGVEGIKVTTKRVVTVVERRERTLFKKLRAKFI